MQRAVHNRVIGYVRLTITRTRKRSTTTNGCITRPTQTMQYFCGLGVDTIERGSRVEHDRCTCNHSIITLLRCKTSSLHPTLQCEYYPLMGSSTNWLVFSVGLPVFPPAAWIRQAKEAFTVNFYWFSPGANFSTTLYFYYHSRPAHHHHLQHHFPSRGQPCVVICLQYPLSACSTSTQGPPQETPPSGSQSNESVNTAPEECTWDNALRPPFSPRQSRVACRFALDSVSSRQRRSACSLSSRIFVWLVLNLLLWRPAAS